MVKAHVLMTPGLLRAQWTLTSHGERLGASDTGKDVQAA